MKKKDRRRRKKLQGKNIMAPLLHRAAIKRRWCVSMYADHQLSDQSA